MVNNNNYRYLPYSLIFLNIDDFPVKPTSKEISAISSSSGGEPGRIARKISSGNFVVNGENEKSYIKIEFIPNTTISTDFETMKKIESSFDDDSGNDDDETKVFHWVELTDWEQAKVCFSSSNSPS